MRRAKQSRADDLSERAQRMASERAEKVVNDYNRQTNQGLTRALDANRELLKSAALESSVLGRQGKADPEIIQPRYSSQNAPLPREEIVVDRSIVGKKKEQVEPAHGNDSLAPGYRRIMNRDHFRQRNPPQPRFNPQDARPDPSQIAVQAGNERVKAFGITQNPAEEARRRRLLEAKIRELASK